MPSIPKVIHQIWIGRPELRPAPWMNTYVKFCAENDWEYKLWTEHEVDTMALVNRDNYDYYYNRRKFFGAADVLRAEILFREGGWYFDADSEMLDGLAFAASPIHEAGLATSIAGHGSHPDRTHNAAMGVRPNHPAFEIYVRLIGEIKGHQLDPAWDTVGGTFMAQALDKAYAEGCEDILVVPRHHFFPSDKHHPTTQWAHPYTTHYWASTKGLYSADV